MTIRYQCKQIHQIHILFPKQTFFTCMEHFDLHIGVLNSIILLKAGTLVNCSVNSACAIK